MKQTYQQGRQCRMSIMESCDKTTAHNPMLTLKENITNECMVLKFFSISR
jgi:hypothetical protein